MRKGPKGPFFYLAGERAEKHEGEKKYLRVHTRERQKNNEKKNRKNGYFQKRTKKTKQDSHLEAS